MGNKRSTNPFDYEDYDYEDLKAEETRKKEEELKRKKIIEPYYDEFVKLGKENFFDEFVKTEDENFLEFIQRKQLEALELGDQKLANHIQDIVYQVFNDEMNARYEEYEEKYGKDWEDKLFIEDDAELDEFYAEHPEMDDRPDSQIPEGMSIDEYTETIGASINEFGEIIREGKQEAKIITPSELEKWLNSESSPLKKREEELSKLEKEEKTISEAEALIDKQTKKEGQDIGEE